MREISRLVIWRRPEILGRAETVGAAREAEVLDRFEEPETRRSKDAAKRAGRAARDGAVREALELLALVYRDAAVVHAGVEELVANVDLDTRDTKPRPAASWGGLGGCCLKGGGSAGRPCV